MFRILGFLGGIIFQIVFGIKAPVPFFEAWGILNLILIFLTFLYRFIAKYSLNFEVTFAEYMQTQFLKIIDCCCGVTIIPQTTYKVTTYYSDGSKDKRTETTNYTCIWGIVEAVGFFITSFFSPVLLLAIIYFYILGIVRHCQGYGQKKMEEMLAAKKLFEENQKQLMKDLPNNIYLEQNNELVNIKDMQNATITVYTTQSVSPAPVMPATGYNYPPANNPPGNYPPGNYPPGNYPPPNYPPPNYPPPYPNPNPVPNNINYVPMPQPNVTMDTSGRNLVVKY